MSTPTETHVVTCFLRSRGDVLLLRRSGRVGSYRGRWGAVSGHVEGDPDASARAEIAEETGLAEAVTLVRRGEPFAVDDPDLERRWIVHPYLFDCARRGLRLNEETTEAAWVPPTEILRRDVVPRLWESYARVAPTLDAIRGDREHGSAYLSLRALEVLRDRAGLLAAQGDAAAREALRTLARGLREARPAMAALRNRINRAMHACRNAADAGTVERAAHDTLRAALDAEDAAAREAARLVAGRRVLTLSWSGTVLDALLQAAPAPAVLVAESRPAAEGTALARRLAAHGLAVTLLPDAAMAYALTSGAADLVLTGADTVLPTGGIVNKTGTCLAALAAAHAGVPFYAAATRDKVSVAEDASPLEAGDPAALYAGEPPLAVVNPTFEITPAALVRGIVTEAGVLPPGEATHVVAALRALEAW